jgi:hypothetical protein
LPDGFHDTLKIRHHLPVSEPQNVEAFRFKEGIAILIGLLPFLEIMRFAIEFNDRLDREASKVGDVVSKRDLAAKTEAINSIGFQMTPQQRFGTCHRSTKLLCPVALARADGCMRHSWLPPSLTLPHKGGGNGDSVPSRVTQTFRLHELNPPASVGMSSGLKP